jgi:hypothetical protein
MTIADSIQNLANANPCIRRLVDDEATVQKNSFLADVRSRFLSSGRLSDKQIAAIAASFEREAEFRKRDEDKQSLLAAGVKTPNGRVTFVGEIVSVKDRQSQFGWQTKATIKTDSGWLCWVTLPAGSNNASRGQRVRMTATVKQSDRDPLFGFGSRPHGIEFLS